MIKKLILILTIWCPLYTANATPASPTLQIITTRRELAMNVLSTHYKDLGRTIDDIERVEDALKKSHSEQKKVTDKKLKFGLSEAIRFLQSARARLDKAEEKLNPIYWEPPTKGFIRDFSYDRTMKSKDYPLKPASKTINVTPKNIYKIIIALFMMSLLGQ